MSLFTKDKKQSNRRRKASRRSSSRPVLRVSARSEEKKQQRMNKLTVLLASALILTLVLWGGINGVHYLMQQMFTRNNLFTVRHLDLRSDGRLDEERIMEYAGVRAGMNLFALDLGQVRNTLESVAIIDHVDVERDLPDTLRIHIRERLPVANLGYARRRYNFTVDREGAILGPSTKAASLPHIVGMKDAGLRPGTRIQSEAVLDALHVLDLCNSSSLGNYVKIRTVDVGYEDLLDMQLIGGERILFKRTDVKNRLIRLASILETARGMGRRIGSVDMRVDKNFPIEYR